MSEWMPTCKEIGAPVDVDLAQCFQVNNGCEAFKEGYCDFDEEYVISNIENLFGVEACQEICKSLPNCKFFYVTQEFCTFFSEKAVKCDGLAGPPEPEYASCHPEDSTTTLSPTPSTLVLMIILWQNALHFMFVFLPV